ncbi:unnamed protein product (macronuclear) [Paramecium tetraurelia]|uniref:Uncharacterized protein n=1 Tax=Paramecium tetraurelia TaxID=5888 RepID=A0DXS9_PARTE|nr:uncharacterized protein GSPATT00021470001 [Paramecium tetraurelia]CAK87846.1 unnamed protein product [Paramecium tetraurelia]|eukprot:XP_001455243.1 hypothetical protein (macronuclear) [Paramecium tetraurelia strain d4-2]
MSKRNNSLTDRKKSKGKLKTAISQRKNSDSQENNFYSEFQIFYSQAQNNTFTKFEYMKEFFHLGLTEFPTDEEINQIQLEILTTSGWNSNLKKNWTLNEKKVLIWLIGKLSQFRNEDLRDLSAELFEEVSKMICRRDKESCKQKWSQMQKIALQQQPFRPEEDKKLYEIIMRYQSIDQGQKWSQISQELNQNSTVYRSSKQCRERWLNNLNPKILKEPWTDEEDIQLLMTVKELGRRWAEISKVMDGRRSENNLKNRFNSLIKREKDLPFLQTQNGSTNNLDELLSGCNGPDITDLQKQVIDAVLAKLKWRNSETQNKINHQKSDDIQQNQNEKSTFQYTIGNIEQEQNIQRLTPCLINLDKNIIYFCTYEILEQFQDLHQYKQQQQFKDHFHRIKSELHIFDAGFPNFKSTLSMIEEIEDSQRSHLNLYPNDIDGFFNLEVPDIFSKPAHVNPIEIITQSAMKYIHRWKTESQLNYRRRNSVTIPRSLPNLIQIQS